MATRPIQILLVEDSPSHAEMIRGALQEAANHYRFRLVTSLQAARKILAESPPDMAIVDLFLPDGKGTELLPDNQEEVALPIIVMTGQGDEELAVTAMKCGAFDYVVKSAAALGSLPHAVERALREWGTSSSDAGPNGRCARARRNSARFSNRPPAASLF